MSLPADVIEANEAILAEIREKVLRKRGFWGKIVLTFQDDLIVFWEESRTYKPGPTI